MRFTMNYQESYTTIIKIHDESFELLYITDEFNTAERYIERELKAKFVYEDEGGIKYKTDNGDYYAIQTHFLLECED